MAAGLGNKLPAMQAGWRRVLAFASGRQDQSCGAMWKETQGGGSVWWWSTGQGWLLCVHPCWGFAALHQTRVWSPPEITELQCDRVSWPLNSLPVAFTPSRLLEFGCHHYFWISNWMSRDRQEPLLVGAEPSQHLTIGELGPDGCTDGSTQGSDRHGAGPALCRFPAHTSHDLLSGFGFHLGSWVYKEEELQSFTECERSQHHCTCWCASPTLPVGAP